MVFGLPSRSICALLQDTQQLDLDICWQVADLVEEDRRVIGQFEAPDLSRERAGKGAFLAAEQLALHQRRGNRRAVDAHHHPVPPSAQPVNVRRDEFLARASLAEQQHGSVGGRNLICLFQGAPDGGALSDDDLVTEALPGFAAQVQVLRLQSLADDCWLQGSNLGVTLHRFFGDALAQLVDLFERAPQRLQAGLARQRLAKHCRDELQLLDDRRRPIVRCRHRAQGEGTLYAGGVAHRVDGKHRSGAKPVSQQDFAIGRVGHLVDSGEPCGLSRRQP